MRPTRSAAPRPSTAKAFIEARTDETVTIDAVAFTSRVLRVNLEEAQQVFAYLATCGTESKHWAAPLDDPLERYWADAIMELALRKALHFLNERIGEIIPHNKTSVMNPGSLRDWPITQQRPLFALIGPAAAAIGITLTESLLMTPGQERQRHPLPDRRPLRELPALPARATARTGAYLMTKNCTCASTPRIE